jgi:hypothetical protein
MTRDCIEFRARLVEALRRPSAGRRVGPGLLGAPGTLGNGPDSLAWHGHVIHCAQCRDLLAEEEALDELLRSLPEPRLPRALAERVLSRLDGVRQGVDLDRLLELSRPEPAPARLAENVLARLHRERRLDRLLDRLPAEVPKGLERRVLANLALARRKPTAQAAPTSARRLPLRLAAGIAIAALATWSFLALRRQWLEASRSPETPELAAGGPGPQTTPGQGQESTVQPDEQLLASLEMLEAWDLFAGAAGSTDTAGSSLPGTGAGPGVTSAFDATLATLDSLDEYLLEFEAAGSNGAGAEGTTPAGDDAPGGETVPGAPVSQG